MATVTWKNSFWLEKKKEALEVGRGVQIGVLSSLYSLE